MRIEREPKDDSGMEFLVIQDNEKPFPIYLGRFETLAEAAVVLRYCSGVPMSEDERTMALQALQKAG